MVTHGESINRALTSTSTLIRFKRVGVIRGKAKTAPERLHGFAVVIRLSVTGQQELLNTRHEILER